LLFRPNAEVVTVNETTGFERIKRILYSSLGVFLIRFLGEGEVNTEEATQSLLKNI